jgi:hypothetical protein
MDRLLTETIIDALLQLLPNQLVHATNSTTHRPTDVTHVKLVSSQETTLSPKTEDVHSSVKHVMPTVESNLVKTNVMDAKHAQMDRLSTETIIDV